MSLEHHERTAGPRLWVGPLGEEIDVDLLDEGRGHAMYVALNPEIFGLPPDFAAEHLRKINAGEDVEFDFDTVIARAEMTGWARTSRDASKGAIAVGASTPEAARRALRVVIRNGYGPPRVQVEIEKVVGDAVAVSYHDIEGRELNLFLRTARLPQGREFDRYKSDPDLIADLMAESAPSFGRGM